MKERLYLLTAIAGLILPWYFFLAFLMENGLAIDLFLRQLFASHISTFFAVDLVIVVLAFLLYLCVEERRRPHSRWWLIALATVAVGPSFSIPLYLYLRARQKERGGPPA